MSNKTLTNQMARSPFHDFATVTDTTQLIEPQMRPANATFIERLEIKPSEQRRIPLGNFADEETLRGFLVEVDPDPMPAKSVATKVTRSGNDGRYTLYLHVANHGKRAVRLEVWQL